MKLAWKIAIGTIAIVAVLVFFSSFLMLSAPNIMAPPNGGPSPDPKPMPEPEPDSSSGPDPLHGVDELLKQMDFGAIAFNAPGEMNIKDSHQIQLILSLNEAADNLKKAITEEGEKIGAHIQVSDRMEARLSGYMFQITAVTPETQAVSKSHRTEWKWEIHPKKQGQHRLHLTLTALIDIDGNNTPRAIRTFSEVIEVNVTTTQQIGIFVKNNWQWLWAAILVPVAGWLWKRRKKQLSSNSTDR